MYKIVFSKKAMASFLALPRESQQLITEKVEALACNPFASNNNVKRLQGIPNCYRLRQGNYRVIYRIVRDWMTIEIINVAHRKEAYA